MTATVLLSKAGVETSFLVFEVVDIIVIESPEFISLFSEVEIDFTTGTLSVVLTLLEGKVVATLEDLSMDVGEMTFESRETGVSSGDNSFISSDLTLVLSTIVLLE